MKVTLRVLYGSELGQQVTVHGSSFLIGRAADCHLRPNCPAVSRHHCELRIEGDQVVLRDLSSKNGTFVNGERVEAERTLRDGDRLAFGMRMLEVHVDPDLAPIEITCAESHSRQAAVDAGSARERCAPVAEALVVSSA